jgi:hypothetical protein
MRQHARSAFVILGLVLASATPGIASTIGQWDGSGVDYNGQLVTWNNPSFYNKINAFLTGAGHTIAANGPAATTALAGFDSFVVADPGRAATAAEVAALSDFVQTGGSLLVFVDRDSLNNAFISDTNGILSGIGSGIRVSTATMDQNMYLTGGVFATASLYDVSGQFLSGTPGHVVTGGTALTRGGAGWTPAQAAAASAYIHYEQLGLGYLFVFGDRLDNNYFTMDVGSTRGRMFLNLASYDNPHGSVPPPEPGPVPEPATMILTATAMAGAFLEARRTKR